MGFFVEPVSACKSVDSSQMFRDSYMEKAAEMATAYANESFARTFHRRSLCTTLEGAYGHRDLNKPIWTRTLLVPGYQTDKNHLGGTLRLIVPLDRKIPCAPVIS